MNPFATAWLAVDLIAVIALLRMFHAGRSARTLTVAMAALQLAALLSALASTRLVVAAASPWIWTTIVAVHIALAVAGLTVGIRFLALLGLAGTAVAVALIVIGSFTSIVVAASVAVILIGAALLPKSSSPRGAHDERRPTVHP